MAILREEALREAAARRADAARGTGPAPGAAATPDLAPAPVPAAAPGPVPPVGALPVAPPARSPQAEPQVPSPPSRPAARRELLPDIEEINSALTGGSQRGGAAPLRGPGDRRPGFRAGFGLMMLLVALAAGTYVMAPRITAMLPQSEEALTTYVGTVDRLRRQLDATVTTAQERVETLLMPVE
jgi:hypothetical protein